ncbi:MAG: alanine--tRNA ligase [Candidatus Omnitrophica bacterium]|nr:alanine--tRNA ligase [Candidatus Omnitrophota bacterium]MCF7893774.1 alanine--tRNA ligase [Candidatus Omnitrophota bacterium]
MKTDKLRRKYLSFFKERGHKLFSSDSLVPDDPSVLFTSAGMNQFKPYFLGKTKDTDLAVSCQRCLRTGDIERVGKTPYHHTFFEMLGNFSFGGYFKKEAIKLAWEFLTKVLRIDKKNLWVSVYKEDKEAFTIWQKEIGVSTDKILKLGQDENFWPANVIDQGPNGPCGPCAEIFFDRGKDKGCKKESCNPACDCSRFVEIWNLVFTQFNRQSDGSLTPLPQKNIDTGMGLERMASVLQNKDSNFEIDILAPAADKLKEILGLKNKQEVKAEKDLVNSIVDHARAVIFSIADGIYPSNEERGYVIRKLLRKALWTANLLGYKQPFVYKLIPLFAKLMQEPYPFVEKKAKVIKKVIKAEEEKFLSTLDEGKTKLNQYLDELKKEKKDTLLASKLFFLYDTYGFPFELSKTAAGKENIDVDQKGAEELLAKQKERSRAGSKFSAEIFEKDYCLSADGKPTEFSGYKNCEISAKIIKIFPLEKMKIDWENRKKSLKKGQKGIVILDKTPFYTESGGQLSDRGVIETDKGKFLVEDAYRIGSNSIAVHQGKVIEGVVEEKKARAAIDTKRRKALARAHTATHILQAALREVLGEHVSQQGSLVGQDRLRFDFTHFKGLTLQQKERIESLVNYQILKADEVNKKEMSLAAAKKEGALAFFKEKYKDQVRMVSISNYSKELCGGCHLDNSSEVAGFAIVSSSSVSSGVRRIEAVVGDKFYQLFKKKKNYLREIAKLLKCNPDKIQPTLKKTLDSYKDCNSKLTKIEKEKIADISKKIIEDFLGKKSGKDLLVYDFTKKDSLSLGYSNFFSLLDQIKKKLSSFFVFLIGKQNGKIRFLCSCSQDLVKQGLSCKDFIFGIKDKLPLKGGGTDKLVQGVINKKEKDLTKKVKDYFMRFLKNESS